jgi:hypothetical protein
MHGERPIESCVGSWSDSRWPYKLSWSCASSGTSGCVQSGVCTCIYSLHCVNEKVALAEQNNVAFVVPRERATSSLSSSLAECVGVCSCVSRQK